MVKEIIEYLKGFEGLENKEILVDYMPSQAGTFCVKSAKFNPVVEKYVDGGELRQYVCTFCMREAFTFDNNKNNANLKLLEELATYIKKQEKERAYPKGHNFIKAETVSGIYIISNDVSTAEYALDMRFLYKE